MPGGNSSVQHRHLDAVAGELRRLDAERFEPPGDGRAVARTGCRRRIGVEDPLGLEVEDVLVLDCRNPHPLGLLGRTRDHGDAEPLEDDRLLRRVLRGGNRGALCLNSLLDPHRPTENLGRVLGRALREGDEESTRGRLL